MGALDAYRELKGRLDGTVYLDEPMNRHTSYHLGGPVALYVECASVHDLGVCFEVLSAEQLPWAIVGKGSNLLVSDAGWHGAVLTLIGQFKEIVAPPLPAEHALEQDGPGAAQAPGQQSIVAGAGVILNTLVQTAFKHGYSGFEFAVGIPGTLGGALAMNAGTASEGIGTIVSKLTVYRPGVGLLRIPQSELAWNYRTSGIAPGDIIVESELTTEPGHTVQIRAKMEASLNRRKATQPLTKPSAGSVFRNPPGASVGKMIEDLGLKGYRRGGAEVSPVHANFIVNNGSATAGDVLAIIMEVRRRVKDEYGTELQTEIRFIGFE
ncbi:MAG: UDP-N-acetylmuramate dehydrogenase [Coriobacteriales bacterium]|jgi:UDP-N-acetylmuramate dehydrogenase|nr:UDP-N-acetylmuramate dehydrogenase [Coriobacteriales bacterium]